MQKLSPKFRKALDAFVPEYQRNPQVIGILVTGSVVHSEPDKNSDIDVHIVVDKGATRTRGNTWRNGVEIEYFINPVRQIRAYFASEDYSAMHMFANGIIIYKKGAVLNDLIKEAKAAARRKRPPMKRAQIENARYGLDDGKKDLEDVYLRQDWFAFQRTASLMIDECLDIFYKHHRVYMEKNKRLRQYLHGIDPKFEALVVKATAAKDDRETFRAMNALISYTEKIIGGPRPREWKLTGPLQLK